MKHVLPVIVLSSVLSAAVTAVAFWTIVPRIVDAAAPAPTVVAKRVMIVDDQGQVVITIGPADPDTYGIGIFDRSGKVAVSMFRDNSSGIAAVSTDASGSEASLSSGPKGGSVTTRSGSGTAYLIASDGGSGIQIEQPPSNIVWSAP